MVEIYSRLKWLKMMKVSLPKWSSSWINKKVSCTPRALNVPLEMGGATCPCRDATSGPMPAMPAMQTHWDPWDPSGLSSFYEASKRLTAITLRRSDRPAGRWNLEGHQLSLHGNGPGRAVLQKKPRLLRSKSPKGRPWLYHLELSCRARKQFGDLCHTCAVGSSTC